MTASAATAEQMPSLNFELETDFDSPTHEHVTPAPGTIDAEWLSEQNQAFFNEKVIRSRILHLAGRIPTDVLDEWHHLLHTIPSEDQKYGQLSNGERDCFVHLAQSITNSVLDHTQQQLDAEKVTSTQDTSSTFDYIAAGITPHDGITLSRGPHTDKFISRKPRESALSIIFASNVGTSLWLGDIPAEESSGLRQRFYKNGTIDRTLLDKLSAEGAITNTQLQAGEIALISSLTLHNTPDPEHTQAIPRVFAARDITYAALQRTTA